MRLLFVVPCRPETGMGHYYRTLALAETAYRLGHWVAFTSDRLPNSPPYLAFRLPAGREPFKITKGLNSYDWVVIDSPSELPLPVKVDGIKTCLIDGVGHRNGVQADLVISQGLEGDYCAPDYLMLRPELFQSIPRQRSTNWLVWGGAADRLGLLPVFAAACPDEPALLLRSDFSQDTVLKESPRHWLVPVSETDTIHWGRQCDRGVVSMGMIVFEMLALRMTLYVFSLTQRHLDTALKLQELGVIRAWPKTGLPSAAEIRAFLAEPFEPDFERVRIDGGGTERVIQLLESKL